MPVPRRSVTPPLPDMSTRPEFGGECGLCQQLKPLRESHLLPAAIFRLARDPTAKNPNPTVVTPRGMATTSKQISTKFLCAECEQRFSRLGERVVLGGCLRGPRFEIRTKLQALTPVFQDGDIAAYDVTHVSRIQPDHYLYFAASVFWRASARNWHHDGHLVERISLGRQYQEELRRYLLQQAPFPAKAKVFVHVWHGSGAGASSVLPSSERIKGTLRHKFCIPGVVFIMWVGQRTHVQHDLGALNNSQHRFMWVGPFENDSIFRGFGKLIRQAEFAAR